MSELVANCPRCKAKAMTFDLIAEIPTKIIYNWQKWYEAFCICRACNKSTIFVLCQKDIKDKNLLRDKELSELNLAVNQVMRVDGYISLKDELAKPPPEHLPPNIDSIFKEGASCIAIGCYNAAGTMFRLCIDLSTKAMLPEDEEANGLNQRVRRSLGLRLVWLFDNAILPETLRELSSCIKDDGNDGAHAGTLSEEDADDILDFTFVLLERIYTEPKRIELANERRVARRSQN